MYSVLKNLPAEDELLELAREFGKHAKVTKWQYYRALVCAVS